MSCPLKKEKGWISLKSVNKLNESGLPKLENHISAWNHHYVICPYSAIAFASILKLVNGLKSNINERFACLYYHFADSHLYKKHDYKFGFLLVSTNIYSVWQLLLNFK